MAKLFYQNAGGGNLNVYDDPQVLVQSDLQAQDTALDEIIALSDTLRTFLAQGGIPGLGIPGGFSDLASFDSYLEDESERIKDILDYFDYGTRVENLTVRDGEWVVPEALESVSDEAPGEEGTKSIDGDNGTWWQSNASGTRTIVFRVKSYKKKFEQIRLRISNANEDRAELQNVTVKAAAALVNIDDAGNTIGTGVNFDHGGDNWMEYVFPTKKRARYLKLEIPGSLHSNPDQVRIREIQVFTGIHNHDK